MKNPDFSPLHPNLLLAIYSALSEYKAAVRTSSVQKKYYLEFGVYSGFSFWFAVNIAHKLGISDLDFHGFDSFEGLPDSLVDKHKNWEKGSYACPKEIAIEYLKKYGMPKKYILHKGWFSEEFLSKKVPFDGNSFAAIVVIDCDVYESAKVVLNYILPFLGEGSVILFDDYNAFSKDPNHGERKAFIEFVSENSNLLFEHISKIGQYGEAFKVKSILV